VGRGRRDHRRLAVTVAVAGVLAVAAWRFAHHWRRTRACADPTVRLVEIPNVEMAPRPVVGAERVARIKQLISSFATMDKPDFGLSQTLAGESFSPIDGQSQAGSMLLTDHRIAQSAALRELVAMGPDALPYLLDSLGDATPTKIVVEHRDAIGAMWFSGELSTNPANPAELGICEERADPDAPPIDQYTVRVGDVCFVAIGQIVGRPYQAMRYQPTACIVINSPVHDSALRAKVRAIWSSSDPAKSMLRSYLADFSTRGPLNERIDLKEGLSSGFSKADHAQRAAALRLLYYFPREGGPLVARRLAGLDTRPTGDDLAAWLRQYLANGARIEGLVKAASWSKDPTIRSAIREIFRSSRDPDVLLAAVPAIDDAELVRARLEPLIRALPAEDWPGFEGGRLLAALLEHASKTARPVFEQYLRDGGVARCLTASTVLEEARLPVPWASDVLTPLLVDKRTTENYGQARVCDWAARALAHHRPDMTFRCIPEDATPRSTVGLE